MKRWLRQTVRPDDARESCVAPFPQCERNATIELLNMSEIVCPGCGGASVPIYYGVPAEEGATSDGQRQMNRQVSSALTEP